MAGSTVEGTGAVIVAKWQSVVNHIHDGHTGHDKLLPSCQREILDRSWRIKWIKPSTIASDKIEAIVLANTLQRDIVKLSPAEQTFPVEAYHSVINNFAPKILVFSYHGMYCRLLLAALHYNENVQRQQATTHTSAPQYNIKFPKFKKGGYSVRKVRCDSTFVYCWLSVICAAGLTIS